LDARTRRWPRRLLILAVLAGVSLAGWLIFSADPGEGDPLTLAIDEIVEEEMRSGPISGMSVAVSRGLRILHAKGYGYADLENELPANAQTIYPVGSITKQFTAAAVLKLVEDGEVRLDAPVTQYLPEYSAFASVTVEQLLTHTAGVADYTVMAAWWETLGLEMPPARLAAFFAHEPLDFEPGSRFSYSNSGYVLLGMVIEAVTGQPYGGHLNARIFVPGRFESTAYCDDRRLIPNRARGYQAVEGGYQHAQYVSMSQAYAAGGICSNVIDLLRWSRALSRGAVVAGRSYDAMSSPARLSDGSRIEYGYGLAVSYLDGHHRLTHIGGMLGFAGHVSHYDQDGVTVAVLTNTEGANAARIATEVARVVLGLEDHALADIALSEDDLAAHTGRYDLGLTTVDVVAVDGRLQTEVTVPGAEGRYVFQYQGDHTFVAADDSEVSVTFSLVDGRVVGMVVYRAGITVRGTRVE
jgi:CubicO group peptidase (beta-lactamase class C family)